MSAMYAWMDIHSLVQMAPWLTLARSLGRPSSFLSLPSFTRSRLWISPLALVDFAFRASVVHFATPCDSDILGWLQAHLPFLVHLAESHRTGGLLAVDLIEVLFFLEMH